MSWFGWGSSSQSSPSTGSTDSHANTMDSGHDSHLKLFSEDHQKQPQHGGQPFESHAPAPDEYSGAAGQSLYMLDQLKRAGIPLKAQMSPYLQMDPSVFAQAQPQFIMPEGNEHGRGQFEYYMGYIGVPVMTGFALGVSKGAFGELWNPQTKELLTKTKGMSGYRRYKPWTTRILNAATKHGSVFAQHAGTAATIYCLTELALKNGRQYMLGSGDDLLNSFGAGTLAGALYRAPHGYRASGIGAAVGFGLVAAWTVCDGDSRRAFWEMVKRK